MCAHHASMHFLKQSLRSVINSPPRPKKVQNDFYETLLSPNFKYGMTVKTRKNEIRNVWSKVSTCLSLPHILSPSPLIFIKFSSNFRKVSVVVTDL